MEASSLRLISAAEFLPALALELLRVCKRLLKSGLSWLLGANFGGAKVFSSESLSLPELPEPKKIQIIKYFKLFH